MEIWIRSQDKECITMANHLYANDDGEIKQQNDIILGTYKTKKRAKEILDEIQSRIGKEFYPENVYQMPEE